MCRLLVVWAVYFFMTKGVSCLLNENAHILDIVDEV